MTRMLGGKVHVHCKQLSLQEGKLNNLESKEKNISLIPRFHSTSD